MAYSTSSPYDGVYSQFFQNSARKTHATLPAQIGAFLTTLHIGRVESRPESLAAAAEVLRAWALQATIEDGDTDFIVDIVGTGGDGHNTFNISTTAAIVAAGAGARVIKHGSRASTSSSGSADLLQSLDCSFNAPLLGTPFPISKVPFTFILAPHYHPAQPHLTPGFDVYPDRETLFYPANLPLTATLEIANHPILNAVHDALFPALPM
ncbi:hypothetical protein CY34DRAFT_16226 [Suillus luteus UH-Slu-Lm8-n1]|uniref:Glycosyl transferase family 3 domain-containing protein n=1 Tax=Suillus luteus UH-Slu-Lm8-n1 TaxID=930992 RepID=A0A0D0A4W7_9AGAM|nr:hypothetical protein CY34DRAFT_16226 [Suillus luteus UH-Slu-Lm8-n1]